MSGYRTFVLRLDGCSCSYLMSRFLGDFAGLYNTIRIFGICTINTACAVSLRIVSHALMLENNNMNSMGVRVITKL
jgi:hypothetical protein